MSRGSPRLFRRKGWCGIAVAGAWLWTGCAELGLELPSLGPGFGGAPALSQGEVAAGLREALELGISRAVVRTARRGGFSDDPALRIPVPPNLERAAGALRAAGMGWTVDELDAAMNRAAERAAGEAVPVFSQAISELTLISALEIWRGRPDAATRHLQEATGEPLRERFRPIATGAMQELGLARIYNDLAARLRTLALLPDSDFDLEGYVVERTLAGLFDVVAREEARIRREPAARTSELLRRVFGAQ